MTELPIEPPARERVPVGRVILAVLGGLGIVAGMAFLVGGGLLVWAHGTQRDADGFYTSGNHRLETLSYAISSQEIDLGTRPARDEVFELGDLATVRITADGVGESAVFVGIGPEDDVAQYLDGVGHAELEDVDLRPFRARYDVAEGGAPASPPGEQDFWVAFAEGPGSQTLEWELEAGQYAVVLMNADGSSGVGVEASVGAKADWVLPLGIGLLVAAFFSLAVGSAMVVAGAHGISRQTPVTAVPTPPRASPVALAGRLDAPLSRWLWLVKWLLLIPHFVVLVVLWVAVAFVSVAAFFAILVTGRYPRPLFDFTVGVLRWSWRVAFYSFGGFATDRYPPFSLGPAPDYPATLEIRAPEQLSRGLVLVKWWLLAIPHYVVLGIIGGGLTLGRDGDGVGGPGLIAWLVLVAAVALLFAGRYPRGIFDFVLGLNRWVYRVLAYVLLLTDEYPPFRLDQGPDEPDLPVSESDQSAESKT